VKDRLEESYRLCRRVTRRRARNFYYAFLLLDAPRRDALSAVYAFMRHCDDLSDEPAAGGPAETIEALERWRGELNRALNGAPDGGAIWPAFSDAVLRYRIPQQYFHDMIDGVISDARGNRFETFDDLYGYCYRVASVAGLSLIHIFGFQSREALRLAERCGIAFQLTNILRDLREDAALDRVYLPREDLSRFGVSAESLRGGAADGRFLELMRFEAARARAFYDESRPLLDLVDSSCRASLWALIEIYSRLLDRIEASKERVLRERVRLSWGEKSCILAQGLLRGARPARAGSS
jgi:phytoene synthase